MPQRWLIFTVGSGKITYRDTRTHTHKIRIHIFSADDSKQILKNQSKLYNIWTRENKEWGASKDILVIIW